MKRFLDALQSQNDTIPLSQLVPNKLGRTCKRNQFETITTGREIKEVTVE